MHQESNIVELVIGIISLLLIAAMVLAITKRLKLPFSVLLVLVGMGLAWLSRFYPAAHQLIEELELSPSLILYVFLPTLIFESAYNLDFRQLRQNLRPILTLAIPGLLLSTLIIGLLVVFASDVPLPAALLLGAILSATDPVAVIALFKRLGAPSRLNVLVEGESLFNDATSIVLSKIMVGIVLAGSVTSATLVTGVGKFFLVFFGGLVVGWLLGLLTGYVLGKVESDHDIEITLTTILAYVSFILAEEFLHVSGVMATVAAGLTLGGWGRIRISQSVRSYLEHYWEYLVFVATALIFLMVGLRVELQDLWENIDMLAVVIFAMLISRALVIYGLMPLLARIPGSEPVSGGYQTVMYWGGLRGAIALAIVLSLPHFEQAELFIVLVMGAVIFTLLVQGLTMDVLVKKLGLDRPPLADRLALLEGKLAGKKMALQRIPELCDGGLYSGPIAEQLQKVCEEDIKGVREALENLRQSELDRNQELILLFLHTFAEEKTLYLNMFHKGHLSERSLRQLLLILVRQIDAVRTSGTYLPIQAYSSRGQRLQIAFFRLLQKIPGFSTMVEGLQLTSISEAFEQAWGHYQGSSRVLDYLEEHEHQEVTSSEIIQQVRGQYQKKREAARREIDEVAEQFPEFVHTMQERLGRRLILLSEEEAVEEHEEHGLIAPSVAEQMKENIAHKLRDLRGQEVDTLRVGPEELLRKVPFFEEIPAEEFGDIAERMKSHTYGGRESIIRQGDPGASLFLIARGVVRVSREEYGVSRDLASLMAGDFFGEMALLHEEPRTATVRAVTPCSIYELHRNDLNAAIEKFPSIRKILEESDRTRKFEQSQK